MNYFEINLIRAKMKNVDLENIKNYLRSNRWKERENNDFQSASFWYWQNQSGKIFEILLPLDKEAPDLDNRIYELVQTLSLCEQRTLGDIVKSLMNTHQIAVDTSREILNVKFKFIDHLEKQEAPAKDIGQILNSLQDSISTIGQSISDKISSSGTTKKNVLEQTELSVIDTFKGSFGINLAMPKLDEQLSLIDPDLENDIFDTFTQKILKAFINLIDYSNQKDKKNLIKELSKYDKFLPSKYRKFLMYIITARVNLYTDWGSIDPRKGGKAELAFESAIDTIEFINKRELEEPEIRNIVGELILAGKNKQKQIIKVEIEHDGKPYKCTIPLMLANTIELTIGNFYSVTFQELSLVNPATYEEKIERTITHISLANKGLEK